MLLLLVLQAELTVVGGPSSEAPAAFNLVRMCVAIVKVLPEALPFECPATAFVHSWLFLRLIPGVATTELATVEKMMLKIM